VSYQIITDDSVETGVLSDAEIDIGNITSATNDNVITDRADRYEVRFNLNNNTNGADNILGDDGTIAGQGLEGGESVQITLTTAPGASTVAELRVPESLVDRSAVTL
jgi:archaellin